MDVLVLLYTFAFLLLALPGAAQTTPRPGAVAIFMEFENKPSTQALSRMQQETHALLAPAGVTPSWHTLPRAGSLTQAMPHVFVVRFKGACRPGLFPSATPDDEEMQPFAAPTLRLASTRTRGRTVLPFAEVECDAIRRITNAVAVRDGAKALGQALGRVLAHELYHLLLQTEHHASNGLAKAVLDGSELLSATFDLREFGK